MRLIFKASELELAQIGFKGENLNNTTIINVKDTMNKSMTKSEKEKKKLKPYIRANAFMINSQEVQQKMENNPSKNLEDVKNYQKMLIGLNYQYILNKTLKYSLQKIAKRGGISDFYLRDFIEKFIPVAYFRIPIFREKFLKLLIETFFEEDQGIYSGNDMEGSAADPNVES